ncbi:substrate-binding domain-containing protein [Robinsoniella sp. KNHs210]|uniref:substrate-binding domain-containing protein n=1 Tax=Robinsoniella sp. KNHs210 TaxID=1469950 RepID=UPI001FA6D8BF|nr:substrate-binding domain-containing protein [Robinsoniella sp. KNHs210]
MVLLAGCSNRQESVSKNDAYVIGVVTKSRDSEYWMSVCSGMEKAADEEGVSVLIVSPDTETDAVLQKKMIQDLLDKKVDALAVSPIDSYSNADYIKKANEMGIPVFAYDTQIADAKVPYIGIDNEKTGWELGKYMAKQLHNKGKVGIISGDLKQMAHAGRIKGFEDYIQKNTDIQVAFVESGYSNLQMSEREITRLMNENPDISGILATSAVTALGIMEYMKGSPVAIVTVDAQEDAIEAVKNGGIAALASQSGYEIGEETVRYIVNHKKGSDQEDQKILPVEVITNENVEDYQKIKETSS